MDAVLILILIFTLIFYVDSSNTNIAYEQTAVHINVLIRTSACYLITYVDEAVSIYLRTYMYINIRILE